VRRQKRQARSIGRIFPVPSNHHPQPSPTVEKAAPVSPLKVLFLMRGEMRAANITAKPFCQNVLDAAQADLALAIHNHQNIDYLKQGNLFYRRAKYIWDFNQQNKDLDTLYDQAQAELGATSAWRSLLSKINGLFLGGLKRPPNNQQSQTAIIWYNLYHMLKMLRQQQLLSKYTWFIIGRTDLLFKIPHFSLELLDPGFIYFPDGQYWGGLPDRYIIVSSKYIEVFLGFLEYLLLEPAAFYNSLLKHHYNYQSLNIEMVLQWLVMAHNLKGKVRVYPYTHFAVRAKNDVTTWATGTWRPELGFYVKYPSEYSSFLRYKEIIRKQTDWKPAFFKNWRTKGGYRLRLRSFR
jgi:hypothetical protein